ncbi:MAG: hypothetical protein IKY59_05545 [Oscillospiraceae bacterium]|nr:hypothetical protein [Oscillospiraceae bacterium]
MLVISQYVRSVTGAALIGAMVLRLLEGKGSAAGIGKIMVGIFMALTVIAPITQVELSDFWLWIPDVRLDAQASVEDGKTITKNALALSISNRVEAYILDKAAQMDVSLTVQVELSDDTIPVPVRIQLQGNASPYAKNRLQNIIRDELGIDKENQIWI